ncbi:rab-like GTPase activating protein [Angomonas deanei]|nr:rab-like GTPase activating protein [Angomonas deanei]|eukprot:EPY25136.1 rab-like GTPase activating protein [Angomonas deanei]
MTEDWSRTNVKMYAKLKERCRKGIPSRLRNVAWQLLIGSHVEMQDPNNAGVYKALCAKVLRNKEIDLVLSRDLNRTFPNHVMFKEDGGVGQTFLKNVLHAYAGTDPEVGYVQGMGFIVGAFSTQLSEEESFWALHSIMYSERYKMRELFKPGFPLLQQFFYQFKRLLARLLPKLSKRFEELSVDPSFYASQWFLTLFVYHFPFRALLRIWDIFFCEGWKIIFRTAIALLKWEQKKLLSLPFEELLPTLKSIQDGKDSRELLERAHKVKFKTVELNQYGNEYWESIGRKPEV